MRRLREDSCGWTAVMPAPCPDQSFRLNLAVLSNPEMSLKGLVD